METILLKNLKSNSSSSTNEEMNTTSTEEDFDIEMK